MYCRNCGKLNDDNVKFCYNCGNKLSAEIVNLQQNSVSTEQNNNPYETLNKFAVIGFSLIILSVIMAMGFIFVSQTFYVNSYSAVCLWQIYTLLQFGVTIAGIILCILGLTRIKKEKKSFALSIVGLALAEIPLTLDVVFLWVFIILGFTL